jgi:hypothetical protein
MNKTEQETGMKKARRAFTLVYFIGLLFGHEDGGDMFIRNSGSLST